MNTPSPLRFLVPFLLGALSASAAQPLRSVAITVGDLGNPFFVQIAKGAEAKARELGGAGVNAVIVASS